MITLRLGVKLAAACLSLLIPGSAGLHPGDPGAPLHVLIVGGGPDPEDNQVAIESNVRYVGTLLPSTASQRVLFTNGKSSAKNVQWEDERAHKHYRAPELPRIDGPSLLPNVKQEIESTGQSGDGSPILLYFTGHGSPNEVSNYENNRYDLWNGGELTVRQMATEINKLPESSPITLVMVECFSGAFGNVLFQNGDPNGPLSNHRVCGFFASVAQRMAAGCTPEINEKEYKDFTGYFFAALTGTDRMGRHITGADYNHDGKVGMDEAFCYALVHDDSIDTPVCTSDVFLRRFIKMPDSQVMRTKYSEVVNWASPAQAAVLNGLSEQLDLSGDRRLLTAYETFLKTNPESPKHDDVALIRFVRLAKSVVLAHAMDANPDMNLRARFQDLVRMEDSNPLRP